MTARKLASTRSTAASAPTSAAATPATDFAPPFLTAKRRAISGIGVAVVAALVVFFLTRPFLPGATSPEDRFSRWTLFLLPTVDAGFVEDVWFGIDLPDAPFTGERLLASALGLVATASAFGWGLTLFAVLSGVFKLGVFDVGGDKLVETPSNDFDRSNARRRSRRAFLSPLETIFFAAGLGFVASSLAVFLLSSAGWGRSPVLVASATALGAFVLLPTFAVRLCRSRRFHRRPVVSSSRAGRSKFPVAAFLLTALIGVAAALYFFSATLPIFEYDALEYHAQGAREVFETGKLAFSPTNVYANMPQGAETAYLIGFNVVRALSFGDVDALRLGSLVGKVVSTSLVFLTAFGAFLFARRFFRDARAGVVAALLYLSFPSVFEVASNGLNDAVGAFAAFAAVYSLLLFARVETDKLDATARRRRLAFAFLTGAFGGFAVSVKYTAVPFVFVPIAVALALLSFRKPSRSTPDAPRAGSAKTGVFVKIAPIVLFLATVAVVSGGWFVRNVVATGNPVYPLAYGVFGDASQTWNADKNARWRRAHSSDSNGLAAFANAAARSCWRDDVASPFGLTLAALVFGVLATEAASLVLPRRRRNRSRRTVPTRPIFLLLTIIIAAYWLAWFGATHRLTRFLLPAAPFAALALGVAGSRTSARASVVGRRVLFGVLLVAVVYSGLVVDLRASGRFAPLRALERDPARFPQASIYFNDNPQLLADSPNDVNVPNDANAPVDLTRKLLLIGEAKAFAYRVPVLYSTCWNDSPLLPLLDGAVERDSTDKIVKIVDAAIVRRRFDAEKIAFVLVDFAELARFRSPGNYGFSNPEIDAPLFRLLERAGVLVPFAIPDAPASTRVYRVAAP